MTSSSIPPPSSSLIISNPTPDDYIELQNPREEDPFTKYYSDLDTEKLIPIFKYSNSKIYEKILNNSKNLEKYSIKQERVDQIRQNKLKIPNFRKIDKIDNNIDININTDNIKIPEFQKNLSLVFEKLGFFNINDIDKLKKKLLPETYFRPDLSKDELIHGKLLYNSKKFQVHYDMDETDLIFINWINEILNNNNNNNNNNNLIISMELFEIIISFFEIQIYQIERILPPTIKDRSTIDYQLQQHAFLYGSDDGTGFQHQDEQACAICNLSDCDNSNSIIFCDGCDIAVHQDCYGISFIPEGPWLCRRCLIARNSHEKCIFCPSTTGAFKQTDSGDWAHVLCTLWTPELYFANPIYMEPIEGVNNIPKSRWKLNCFICKQKIGICIQCSKSSCFTAYHVTCAKRSNLFMKFKKGFKSAINNKTTLISYCDKHTPIEWGIKNDIKNGIDKTRLYFHDKNKENLQNNNNLNDNEVSFVTQQEFNELERTKSKNFKWRLNSNVYVIPNIIINKLIKFLNDNKLPNISKLTLNYIAKYYTLKRQYLGKPLIKKPDIFNHASLPEDSIKNREETVKYFKQDIDKLLEISKILFKRSKTLNSLIEDKLENANLYYNLKIWIFQNLLSFFKNHFNDCSNYLIPKYSVKPNIYQIISKVESGTYDNLEDLIIDIEKFSNWLLNIKFNNNSSLLELQKLFKAWQRYKKAKYHNAREYYDIVTYHWDSLKNEFKMNEDLSLSPIEQNIEDNNNNNNNNDNNSITINSTTTTTTNRTNKIVTKAKKKSFKGSAEMKRLGIDISNFNSNESNNESRSLRKRRSTSPTAEEEDEIGNKRTNNHHNNTVLRERLNRVRLRTNVQYLRKSARVNKK